ncbi:MAG: hypothetical protein ACK41O_27495 [Runella zeae]
MTENVVCVCVCVCVYMANGAAQASSKRSDIGASTKDKGFAKGMEGKREKERGVDAADLLQDSPGMLWPASRHVKPRTLRHD